MTRTDSPLWYKDAIIYELHVRAFSDGDGDGVGDFRGLITKLPYLRGLGVDCLWLLPFYPSPLRDDGYDIADYTSIHPDYGSMADFRRFLKEAHSLGMKVITELVINHTSDRHPWFQRARSAPTGSAARNWYVWSDTPDRWNQARIIFTDTETSNWTWDPKAGQYYWHRFFGHQPDLNFDHPPVRRAIERVMRFWLDLGVDGLRLDAIPYLFERDGTNCENLPETHDFIKHLRRVMDEYQPQRLFLAEANQWPEDACAYFGDDDECHMTYHFPLMPRLFMALAQQDRHPIVDIMRRTPEIPKDCQWALFLRNHDELTLEMVTDKERDYMLRAYAANPRMRVNVGIRRRLAPLVENSRPRIELLYSLLLSMPGTPVIYYGDEIGMGDNIYMGDRNGVRTPMQWNADRNAGFSSCDFSRLYAPPILDPVYHFAAVNVEAQERDPSSLLAWTRRMIRLRSRAGIFGRAGLQFIEPSNRRILSFVRRHGSKTILVVANLSRYPQPFSLDLSGLQDMIPVEMQGGTPFAQIGRAPWPLALGPWGWMWFELFPSSTPSSRTLADLPLLEQEEPVDWWDERGTRVQFLSTVLPGWMPGSAWMDPSRDGTVESVPTCSIDPVHGSCVIATFEVRFAEGSHRTIRLPFSTVDEYEALQVLAQNPRAAVCRIRTHDGRQFVVVESLSCTSGPVELGHAMEADDPGGIRYEEISPIAADGLGASVAAYGRHHIVGLPNGAVLKWYHEGGPAPERSARLLGRLESKGFSRSTRLLGTVRSRRDDAICGLLLERIEHQSRLGARLEHEFESYLESSRFDPRVADDALLPSLELCRELSTAISELHAHLDDGAIWSAARRNQFMGSLRDLFSRTAKSAAAVHGVSVRQFRDRLWGRANELLSRIPHELWKGEAHGDLHLGQILLRDDRMIFLDFDGNALDPEMPLPFVHDLATVAWSFRKIASPGPATEDAPARERWYRSCFRELAIRPDSPMVCGELLELMLMRRWSEELVLDPRSGSASLSWRFLDGGLDWTAIGTDLPPHPTDRTRSP